LIPRDAVIQWLRQKGFHFWNRTLRNELYRKGTVIVSIPTASNLKEAAARDVLTKSHEVSPSDANDFIKANKK
jgi:hypothetical protein